MTLFILFLAGAILLFAWMHFIEPYRYRISRHSVTLRKPLARPLRIMHLSDIHFAGRNERLSAFFDALAAEPCDYVFITGDIIDCIDGIPEAVRNLSKLRPSRGTYAVLGNHDYLDYRPIEMVVHNICEIMDRDYPENFKPNNRQRVDLLEEGLREAGIRVLKNETVADLFQGNEVLIHGLNDPTTGQANLRRTMENFDAEKTNILLTHTVDVFLDIGKDEIDLSFSGHSHGGQIRLPFWGAVITHTMMGRKFASGVLRHKGAVCCISRGIGTSRYLKLRFLCPPEGIILEVS